MSVYSPDLLMKEEATRDQLTAERFRKPMDKPKEGTAFSQLRRSSYKRCTSCLLWTSYLPGCMDGDAYEAVAAGAAAVASHRRALPATVSLMQYFLRRPLTPHFPLLRS
jgi:hypothetical protein